MLCKVPSHHQGLVATYQSEVDALTLEVLRGCDQPLNKQHVVSSAVFVTLEKGT
jgi:hypothetical protein